MRYLDSDGRNPRRQRREYRRENNKHRENPRIESAQADLRGDREIKMHPFSRGIVSISVSAKWKQSLRQLSRNSADRYPFLSEEPRPIVGSRPNAERTEKNMREKERSKKERRS